MSANIDCTGSPALLGRTPRPLAGESQFHRNQGHITEHHFLDARSNERDNRPASENSSDDGVGVHLLARRERRVARIVQDAESDPEREGVIGRAKPSGKAVCEANRKVRAGCPSERDQKVFDPPHISGRPCNNAGLASAAREALTLSANRGKRGRHVHGLLGSLAEAPLPIVFRALAVWLRVGFYPFALVGIDAGSACVPAEVFRRKLVTALAMGFTDLKWDRAHSVFVQRHGLQMSRIATSWHPTKMVNGQALWDRPREQLVSSAMNTHCAEPRNAGPCISGSVEALLPNPTGRGKAALLELNALQNVGFRFRGGRDVHAASRRSVAISSSDAPTSGPSLTPEMSKNFSASSSEGVRAPLNS